MKEGEKSRKVGATNMNERSSRSHTIFRIKLESTNRMDEDDTMVLEEEDGGEFPKSFWLRQELKYSQCLSVWHNFV